MKCRYGNCKLGGEVEKKDAIYENKAYYHKECYEKKVFKEKLRDKFRRFPKKDMNIALTRAIDDMEYDMEYVEYVIEKHSQDIKSAYNLLYYLKFESNQKEWASLKQVEEQIKVNQSIKHMDIQQDEVKFTYKKKEPKRFKIY